MNVYCAFGDSPKSVPASVFIPFHITLSTCFERTSPDKINLKRFEALLTPAGEDPWARCPLQCWRWASRAPGNDLNKKTTLEGKAPGRTHTLSDAQCCGIPASKKDDRSFKLILSRLGRAPSPLPLRPSAAAAKASAHPSLSATPEQPHSACLAKALRPSAAAPS